MKLKGVAIPGFSVTKTGKVKKGHRRKTSVSRKIAERKSKRIKVVKGAA